MRSRRQKRVDAGLPLFDQPEAPPADAARPEPPPPPAPIAPAPPPSGGSSGRGAGPPEPAREPDLVSTRLSEAELADLPLRPPGGDAERPAGGRASRHETLRALARRRRPPRGVGPRGGGGARPSPVAEPTPVERPARVAERARAAAVDALLFAALSAVVVYFTGRAARVDLAALASSWPALASYLGLLALFYAGYFTGTTGQTPGKLVTGLRVVGANGRPPGYLRAMARALVGLLGTGLVGLGLLPMAFDPAARALHDRLFRTRVVRG